MNPEAPSMSVVIPVYNAEATLADQVEAVLASMTDDMELLVVDNRSTDRSSSIANEFAASDARVRVIVASDRQGEPHARNTGVRSARSDLIAFCDADDVVSSAWAPAMLAALSKHQFITGPVDVELLNPVWLAGFRGRRLFAAIPRTAGDVPFAHGCNFAINRRLFDRLGGFDERSLIGCDVDFSIRAHLLGVPIAWAEGALVHYRHRASTRERWHQAMAFGRVAKRLHETAGRPYPLMERCWRQGRRAAWLLVRVPLLYDRSMRARWAWTLALAIGEIRGGR